MSRKLVAALALSATAALAACGTPQQQCISRNTGEYRTVARLLDEVEGNLARGYAWEERVVERTEWRPCRDIVGVKDGRPIVVTRSCWRDVADTERYRVPIDPAAETRKRDNLLARLAALQPGAEAAIRACRAAYPEEAAASPAR